MQALFFAGKTHIGAVTPTSFTVLHGKFRLLRQVYYQSAWVDEGKVDNVRCVTCSGKWDIIRKEAARRNLRGASLRSLKQYVDGIHYVHRSNLERHCTGPYHQLAVQLSNEESGTSTSEHLTQWPCQVDKSDSQPSAHAVILDKSTDTFTKYFRTALWLAEEELPAVKFDRALRLQRNNGMNIPQAAEARFTAKTMTHILSDVVRSDVKRLISECHFFSTLSDGSEARKTREEKELIYVPLAFGGVPVTLFLKCQRMIDFGGTDAAAVLNAIREAFSSFDVDLSVGGKHRTKLVSACEEGASTNMGCKRGSLTVLKNDNRWLVIVHCSLHRLELAVKDGFKASKDFEEIDRQMISLFKTFKDSGKCWRILLLLASRMGVSVRRFVKSQGTRFQAHKKSVLDVVIYNFCVLLLFAEYAWMTTSLLTPGMKSRFEGSHKKWGRYEYAVRVCFYREVLQATSSLSLLIERDIALMTDVIDALEDCNDSLVELLEEKWQEPPQILGGFQCTTEADIHGTEVITMKVNATSAPSTVSMADLSKLSENQKKTLEKHVSIAPSSSHEFKLTHIHEDKQALAKIQSKLIPEIKTCINERFENLKSEPLFQAMRILDHTTWDPTDKSYGIGKIQTISDHYQVCLASVQFNLQDAFKEWKVLKKIVNRSYSTYRDKLSLWKKVFENRHSDLQNILLIIEICLAIAVAQGMVERGFSLTRRIITDSRTRLKNDTLDDLLMLLLNVTILRKILPDYDNTLIARIVKIYTERRRNPKSGSSGILGKQRTISTKGSKLISSQTTNTKYRCEETVHVITSSDSDSTEKGNQLKSLDVPRTPISFSSDSVSEMDAASQEFTGVL